MNAWNRQNAIAAECKDGRKASTRWSISTLALSMLLSSLGVSIANVALPALAKAFAVPFQEVQWVVLAYLLAITALIVSVGRLGDIVGHRLLLLAGIFVFTVASVLCAIAATLGALIAARALQGVGSAILMVLAVALVRETVPKERTGSAMGLLATMSAIGTALGPTLGGILIAGYGWRAIFLIMAPLGILNFLLAYAYLPGRRGQAKLDLRACDLRGTVLLGFTLASYTLAMTTGHGWTGAGNAALLLVAISGGGLFVYAESKAQSPLIPLNALRSPALSASLIMNVLVSTVMMATLVVGPFYLSNALKLGDAAVGFVMSIGPIIAIMSGVPAGGLADRFGAANVVLLGLITMAAGATALSFLAPSYGLFGYVIAIAILTPGYQLFQAANNTSVMMDVPQDRRGTISGLLSLSRNLGLTTGASLMGTIFALASGEDGTTESAQSALGMQVTFAVAAILTVVGIAVLLVSRMLARQSVSSELRP